MISTKITATILLSHQMGIFRREREREREKQFSFSEHLLLKLAYTNLYIIEKNNNRIRKQIIWTHQAEPKTNNATILSKL